MCPPSASSVKTLERHSASGPSNPSGEMQTLINRSSERSATSDRSGPGAELSITTSAWSSSRSSSALPGSSSAMALAVLT